MSIVKHCPDCGGTGSIWKEKVQVPCGYCGGKKFVGPVAEAAERIEVIGDATLLQGDARQIAPMIDAVDVVFTSPPYAQQRDYGARIADWRGLVSEAIAQVQDSGSTQVFVNLGLVHRNGEVIPYWEPFIADMKAAGWRFFGWYVWDQGPGLPGDWAGRFAPSHEFVFHFNRTRRKPHKIIPCTHAGKSRGTKSGLRATDGSISGWSADDLTTQELRIGDSVIRTVRHKHVGGIEAGHPAVFPVAFAQEVVRSYSDTQELVLDPFMGSGTTGVACLKLGRRFIGIEIESKYFDIAVSRIREAHKQPDIFLEAARKPAQTSLTDLLQGDAA